MILISGIYQILNKITGKSYVGSSVNIRERWATHLRKLKEGNHLLDSRMLGINMVQRFGSG